MQNKAMKYIRTIILIILLALMLFPVIVMVDSSLKTYNEIITWPPKWFNPPLRWENYSEVIFGEKTIMTAFFNSLKISFASMSLCVVIGTLAAYGVTRFYFLGKRFFLMIVIATQMFSAVLLVNPMYTIFRNLGILDTPISLIISTTATSLPMTIWLLYSYFSQIPMDYEEASWMDGASRVRGIFEIVLPLAIPGIITAGLFAFIVTWGDLIFARTFITSAELRTISQALTDYQDVYKTDWELQMAASVITTIPPFIIFLLIQNKLVQGMTQEGVKG